MRCSASTSRAGEARPRAATAAAGSRAAAANSHGEVTVEDFAKLDLRIAKIVAAEAVDGADKLLKLTLDIGDGQRTVFAGIRSAYAPEQLRRPPDARARKPEAAQDALRRVRRHGARGRTRRQRHLPARAGHRRAAGDESEVAGNGFPASGSAQQRAGHDRGAGASAAVAAVRGADRYLRRRARHCDRVSRRGAGCGPARLVARAARAARRGICEYLRTPALVAVRADRRAARGSRAAPARQQC